MNMKASTKNNTPPINAVTIIIIAAFMMFLNFNCGFISDDYHFKYIWTSFNPKPQNELVDSFSDIVVSMKNYYYLSGGRVLCHFWAYCLMTVDKAVFNILNSLVFAALGYLSYVYIKRETKLDHPLLLPGIFVVYLLFLPSFGDNCIWLSGAVNYLWPAVLLVLCFLQINRYADESSGPDIKRLPLLCILLLISSLTNEITGGMLIVFMFITFVWEHKFKVKYLILFVPAVLGTLAVITAPGNSNRAQKLSGHDLIDVESIIESFFQYMNNTFDRYSFALIIVLFMVLTSFSAHEKLSDIIVKNKIFITGLAGIIALCISGQYIERPLFLGAVPMIIGFWITAKELFAFISDASCKSNYNVCAVRKAVINIYISFSAVIIISTIFDINKYDVITMALQIIGVGLLTALVILAINRCKADEKALSEIKNTLAKLKKISQKLPTVLLIIMLIPVTLHTILYLKATNERSIWLDESRTAIINNDYEKYFYKSYVTSDMGNFFPKESVFCDSSPYTISWRAADMGIYIYADPYEEAHRLELLMEKQKSK